MADAHANFAYSTVATAPVPATTGTSLVVAAGDGTKFPAVPFNATIWPVSAQPTTANAEIVRVTNIATDTFTITRIQESTSARTVVVGDQIATTVTAKTLTDVETVADGAVAKSLVDAKGDLIVASAADTVARLAVGTDFTDALIPDSSAATGLRWGLRRRAFRLSGSLFETFNRLEGGSLNGTVLVSQRINVVGIELPSGLVVTSITFKSGATALATGVHQYFALLNQSTLARLAVSADDTSTAWAAHTKKTLAMTSPFTTTYAGAYYLAILVDATTVPTLICRNAIADTGQGINEAPIPYGTANTAVTSIPDPIGAVTAGTFQPWATVN